MFDTSFRLLASALITVASASCGGADTPASSTAGDSDTANEDSPREDSTAATTDSMAVTDSATTGSPTIASSLVKCEAGSSPKLVYLTKDPRTTGEMHAMFSP